MPACMCVVMCGEWDRISASLTLPRPLFHLQLEAHVQALFTTYILTHVKSCTMEPVRKGHPSDQVQWLL